jgi:hypothetical protein
LPPAKTTAAYLERSIEPSFREDWRREARAGSARKALLVPSSLAMLTAEPGSLYGSIGTLPPSGLAMSTANPARDSSSKGCETSLSQTPVG